MSQDLCHLPDILPVGLCTFGQPLFVAGLQGVSGRSWYRRRS